MLRKHAPIMGFVFVALFAMSCLTPIANAASDLHPHDDLELYVIYLDSWRSNITYYGTYDNPYGVTAPNTIDLYVRADNWGDNEIVITRGTIEIIRVQVVFGWEVQLFDQTVYSELWFDNFRIPAGTHFDEWFYLDTETGWEGLYRIVVTLDFDIIDDLTLRSYVRIYA